MGDSKDAIACHARPPHGHAYGQTDWHCIDDHLCLAIAMRRACADRRTDRRADSCAGGKAMTPTLQVFLIVSAAMFSVGLVAAVSRRQAFVIPIGDEMMM